MFIIDSHCHLNYLRDEEKIDIEKVILDASSNGVKIINNICTNVDEFDSILELSNQYKNVYCSIGQHPEHTEPIKIEDFLNKDIKNYKGVGAK